MDCFIAFHDGAEQETNQRTDEEKLKTECHGKTQNKILNPDCTYRRYKSQMKKGNDQCRGGNHEADCHALNCQGNENRFVLSGSYQTKGKFYGKLCNEEEYKTEYNDILRPHFTDGSFHYEI